MRKRIFFGEKLSYDQNKNWTKFGINYVRNSNQKKKEKKRKKQSFACIQQTSYFYEFKVKQKKMFQFETDRSEFYFVFD